MKYDFLNYEKATITVMVQADNPTRIKELMDKSLPAGAEAFGIQFEQMLPEFRKPEIYRELFDYAEGRPSYVTNYRDRQNEGKSDEELGDELVELAEWGADLCDVMGDYFDRQPDEVAVDENAINKQISLINRIHEKGARVLMSSHVMKYTPAERVLEIALEHQRRGADISKIVVGAENREQELENLKIINLLKEKLDIPFLFLSGGECKILRRIGGEIGSSMYLCVYEHDSFSTLTQPLLSDVKLIRYLLNK